MSQPSSAQATPIGSAHSMVAMVGSVAGGTDVSASEKLPSPVQLFMPTKTSAPMPDASSPGSATRVSVAPPMPAASMIRNAASSGDPSSVLIAAKLPADAMIVSAIGGASFFVRCTVSAASPPPMAISGASGPRTAPRLKVVKAARMTPGSSWGWADLHLRGSRRRGSARLCRAGTGWSARSATHTRPTRARATTRAYRRRTPRRAGRRTRAPGPGRRAPGSRRRRRRWARPGPPTAAGPTGTVANERPPRVHGCRVTLGGHRLTPCCSCSGVVSSPTSRREAQAPGWGRARRHVRGVPVGHEPWPAASSAAGDSTRPRRP